MKKFVALLWGLTVLFGLPFFGWFFAFDWRMAAGERVVISAFGFLILGATALGVTAHEIG